MNVFWFEMLTATNDSPFINLKFIFAVFETDELTPGWVCYYYDETLARHCLVGLRGGVVKTDAVKNGGFGVIVSGASKGCGSSRETAPYSEPAIPASPMPMPNVVAYK